MLNNQIPYTALGFSDLWLKNLRSRDVGLAGPNLKFLNSRCLGLRVLNSKYNVSLHKPLEPLFKVWVHISYLIPVSQ